MNEFQEFFNDNKKPIAIALLICSFLLVVWSFSGSIIKVAAYICGRLLGRWCFNAIWPDEDEDEENAE